MLNYYVSNGLVKAVTRDSNCKSVKTELGYYNIFEEISWSVLLNDFSLIVTTDKVKTMKPFIYSWMNTSVPIYFKHGAYV